LKLLTLTNRYYSLSIVIILLVGGFISYLILKQIINNEFNNKLFAEKEQFIYEWHTYENLKETLYLNVGDRIDIEAVLGDPYLKEVLIDTVMYDNYEKIELPFRQLKFSEQLQGKFYIITITKSMLPTKDLIQGVGEIILFLVVALVLSIGLVTRIISKKIWTPFNNTLSSLGRYQISNSEKVDFSKTNIDEFSELNHVLSNMIEKSRKDYENLKEFTENTSHEIQTPLAIIKSKAELLLQEGNLKPANLEDVGKIYEAANRLSKLKKGLSMLSKIENNQFEEVEPIDVAKFLDKKISNFEELIEMKHIELTKVYNGHPTLILNNTLTYVLITNLINNAIKHNVDNGTIHIKLNDNELTIENTGNPTTEDPEKFFQRFKKGSNAYDSSGLGLALIKKVCEIYQMSIRYTVNENIHKLSIQF
jgi:signal transduction histidine kinase